MRRPCNEVQETIDPDCKDRRMFELTPRQQVMTKIAWLGDNFDYLNRDFMQTKVIELLQEIKALKPGTMDDVDDIPF